MSLRIKDWIDAIPDNKLDGTYVVERPAYTDKFCRLDCQSITSDGTCFNLQVQVNMQCPDTTMAKLKSKSVAWCLAPIENQWTPQQVKNALKESVTGWPVYPPRDTPKVEEEKKPEKPVGNKKRPRSVRYLGLMCRDVLRST
jgi:hypothetical protein